MKVVPTWKKFEKRWAMVLFHKRVHHGIFFSMRNTSGPGGPRMERVLRCHFQGEEAWQLYS